MLQLRPTFKRDKRENMAKQRTLNNVVTATGVGVHSGRKTTITMRPAPENTGVVFRRIDLDSVIEIPAKPEFIGDTTLSTSLVKDGVKISTVEHLLSAFSGLGLDNVYVDLDAEEVPIMDGSSAPFIFLIRSAGIQQQNALKKFVKIKKPIEVSDGDKRIKISPFDGFKVAFKIDFQHPMFNGDNQFLEIDFSSSSYVREIARARTFGFRSDYEYIKKNNMALGASLDNAVVFDKFNVLNQDGLRYQDEPLKHKVLDVVGDLYLLGYSVIGALDCYKSGHAVNSLLLKVLL